MRCALIHGGFSEVGSPAGRLHLSPSMALTPGARLAHYEIVSTLGSGGMGVVYRARDTRLGRDVAIKVMAPHVAADPIMRGRFETEARAVASLSHPGILSIYELGVSDDAPFAVMELLQGQNLRERVLRGPIPWREAADIAAAIADALAAAHGQGIVHRDLKPENVFLTSGGMVKILDFGLALQRGGTPLDADSPTIAPTAQGVILGTFGYMAPEQITGGAVDGRTDVFALGCLLYEMLTGRRMFNGATPQEVIARVLHDSPPDLSSADPLAPHALGAILRRALERDPSHRFESAHDLSAALRSLLSSGAGVAATLPRASRARGKSIAVLPFANAAGPELEYLSDGIAESIINSLSQLDALRVVPRGVAFRYKGLQADPASLGTALNARTVLTGRLAQHGDVLSIQTELVDTRTESQLWGEQYRQKIGDLLTVQQEIAWHISEALRLKLTAAQKRKLGSRSTLNADAYQAYLRGRHHWNHWTPEAFRRALEEFQRAVDLDPLYALAYAGLGDTYGAMSYYGYMDPRHGFARARAAATRALELDPELAEAHVTVAIEQLFAGWNWTAAGQELQHALARNPRLAIAHTMHALLLVSAGRFEESLAAARTGRDLDPLSVMANMGVAWSRHFSGDHEQAARAAQRARELAPAVDEAGNIILASYEALGRFEDAARLMDEQRVWGFRLDGQQLLAAWREGGPEAYWRRRLEMMHASTNTTAHRPELSFAIVHARLGEPDLALDHLEKLVAAHAGGAVFLGIDPVFRTMHGMPRFEALLTRVGSPRAAAPRTGSP
jgi:serine/threonine protein kinase